ncbi:MAG TPA: DUF1844 domain-containing protein [Candidatus Acidoferrales bacterium]|nr:DUF1844 domain-containing protein [Candidatus Acidoferrales bacterium]
MSREEDEQRTPAFKVEDRRRFSETGEARAEAPDAAPGAADKPAALSEPAPNFEMGDAPETEDLNFSSFIVGLTTQALVHLGEIPDPISKQVAADLSAARQMIDILGLLQQKTRGNLDKTESDLLDGMLYDLRLRFVERTKR